MQTRWHGHDVAIVAHGPENGNGGGTKKIYYNKSKKKNTKLNLSLLQLTGKSAGALFRLSLSGVTSSSGAGEQTLAIATLVGGILGVGAASWGDATAKFLLMGHSPSSPLCERRFRGICKKKNHNVAPNFI